MRNTVGVLVVAVCGCGVVAETEDIHSVSVDVRPQDLGDLGARILAPAFTNYVRAVLGADSATVLSILSSERLARVDRAGGIVAVMGSEAAQVRRQLGEAPELGGGFTADEVASFNAGAVVSVRFSLNGWPAPKAIYFVREEGEYKLNLMAPNGALTLDQPQPGVSRQALINDGYIIRNRLSAFPATNLRSFRVNEDHGAGCSSFPGCYNSQRDLSGNSATTVHVFSDSCSNIFLNGAFFVGKSGGGVWSNPFLCAYQWFGDDFFNSAFDQWQCSQTCT